MPKLIYEKRRKLNILNISKALSVFAIILALISVIFVRSYNVSLQNEKNNLENIIVSMEEKNDTMQLNIDKLGNRDRIMGIVEDKGFEMNPENIYVLAD